MREKRIDAIFIWCYEKKKSMKKMKKAEGVKYMHALISSYVYINQTNWSIFSTFDNKDVSNSHPHACCKMFFSFLHFQWGKGNIITICWTLSIITPKQIHTSAIIHAGKGRRRRRRSGKIIFHPFKIRELREWVSEWER